MQTNEYIKGHRLLAKCLERMCTPTSSCLLLQLLLYIARAHHDAGDQPAAKRYLLKALHIAPGDIFLRFNLGFVLQVGFAHTVSCSVCCTHLMLTKWHSYGCTYQPIDQQLIHFHCSITCRAVTSIDLKGDSEYMTPTTGAHKSFLQLTHTLRCSAACEWTNTSVHLPRRSWQ